MSEERIAVISANGQDGFLSLVRALEQDSTVMALTRNMDSRITELVKRHPKLVHYFRQDYLEDTSWLISRLEFFHPTHVFYFASNHGPFGTMKADSNSLAQTNQLSRIVPRLLINLAKKIGFGLTFPLSSRIFSGYLTGRSGEVSIEEGTEPKPEDFYGQAKVDLMKLSEVARQRGVYVNSPILFNHDSIFKKPGYVGSAAAKVIASRLAKSTYNLPINLDARVDISDALLVTEAVYDMRQGSNSSPLLGSGVAMRVGTLVSEQTSFLGEILNIATDSGEYLPDGDHAVLVSASSSISRHRGSGPERNSWLSVMAFSELAKNQIVTPAVIPNLLRAPLPRIFWGMNPSSLHQLSPAR